MCQRAHKKLQRTAPNSDSSTRLGSWTCLSGAYCTRCAPNTRLLKCAVHYTFICSKLPLLYINDVPVLGQSAVISRFLARRFGMMGDDDL